MEENLNNCLILFEYTGLQYFSLKSLTTDNAKNRPTFARTVLMLSLFVCINTLAICFIIRDHSIINGELTPKNLIMYLIKHSMNAGFVSTLSVSLIESFVTTRSIKKFYLNSKEIALLCLSFKLFIDFKKISKNYWKRILLMLSFILAMHGSVMIAHVNNTSGILQMLFGVVPVLLLMMTVYKFIFYVDVVNSQLRMLEKLFEDSFQYDPIKIIDNVADVNLTQVKPSSSIFVDNSLNKLRIVWKIYNLIYDNGNLINESIGMTALALLISLVICLTVSGYEMFVTIVGGRGLKNIPGNLFPACLKFVIIKFDIFNRNHLCACYRLGNACFCRDLLSTNSKNCK